MRTFPRRTMSTRRTVVCNRDLRDAHTAFRNLEYLFLNANQYCTGIVKISLRQLIRRLDSLARDIEDGAPSLSRWRATEGVRMIAGWDREVLQSMRDENFNHHEINYVELHTVRTMISMYRRTMRAKRHAMISMPAISFMLDSDDFLRNAERDLVASTIFLTRSLGDRVEELDQKMGYWGPVVSGDEEDEEDGPSEEEEEDEEEESTACSDASTESFEE